MNQAELIEMLSRIHFLHGVSRKVLEQIASIAEVRDYGVSEIIFREGEVADSAYLVVSGKLSLELSPSTIYHWIGSGKLDEAHGLRKLGSRRLIDWQVFQGCLERGEFN